MMLNVLYNENLVSVVYSVISMRDHISDLKSHTITLYLNFITKAW